MKILHTSDWHVGQNFKRFDREDEHAHFFKQLARLMAQEQPDALVVSGDVYHTSAPSASAQRFFVEGVMSLHDASPDSVIVITAGNHDSGTRIDAERELWRRLGIYVMGSCRRREDGTFDPLQFVVDINGKGFVLAAPYFHPSNYPLAMPETDREQRQQAFYQSILDQVADRGLPVVMMAHLAVENCNFQGHEDVPVGGMYTEPLSVLGTGYDYLALGHIHKPQCINDHVYYSGSPIPVTFSEDYPHYVNIVDIVAHGDMPTVRQIEIEPLRRVLTIPPDGAPTDKALEAFAALDDTDDSYVRILIDQDGPMSVDFEDRVRRVAQGKACRFCEVRVKPREATVNVGGNFQVSNMQEFENIKPIDIAKRHYERARGIEMDADLVKMLEGIITKIETADYGDTAS